MFLIRTDANEEIASGHLMRCATIARELQRCGEQVQFVVADSESEKLAVSLGFSCSVLHTDWRCPDTVQEIKQMRSLLAESMRQRSGTQCGAGGRMPGLLLDSYKITGEYTRKLSENAVITVIDDLFEYVYAADVVINYTLYHDRFDYAGRYGGQPVKLLLGGKYVPLREQFAACAEFGAANDGPAEGIQQNFFEILLICGGGDRMNALGALLSAATKSSLRTRFYFHVVAGVYNPNKEQLRAKASEMGNVTVYENVENMSELMERCDAAVSAASTVLYECCAMQLPTIFFCVADNQRYDRECFTKAEVMLYAGDMRTARSRTAQTAIRLLEKLCAEPERRAQMKSRMRRLVDGKGAQRIAKEMIRAGGQGRWRRKES